MFYAIPNAEFCSTDLSLIPNYFNSITIKLYNLSIVFFNVWTPNLMALPFWDLIKKKG